MRKSTFCLMIAALALAPFSQAQALCIYKGELTAKTTLAQEYADSHWVVRAKLVDAENHYPAEDSNDPDASPWVLYTVQIEETFKGNPTPTLTLFSQRNSGGFYLERPWTGAHPGDEFLLFLNPMGQDNSVPAGATGSTIVNYSCGQSKTWGEVDAVEGALLEAMAFTAGLRPEFKPATQHLSTP
jgi:hypothetical protein